MTLDEEKVLKKLKNKHTKESIILLDYIDKLEKEIEQLENKLDNSLNEQKEREKYTHSLEEKLDKLQKENKKLKDINEEIITELYTRLS